MLGRRNLRRPLAVTAEADSAAARRAVRRSVPGFLKSPVAVGATLILVGLVVVPFFIATTFTGDDHLFLAFTRYVRNPLSAFVVDRHGGEYYRPVPMLLWWLLATLGRGSTWPFAVAALALHTVVATEVGLLVRQLRADGRTALFAALLFWVSPHNRLAAYWFSASTDLLATACGLACTLAMLDRPRPRTLRAAGWLLLACLSKEWAVIVPVLALLAVLAFRAAAGGERRRWSLGEWAPLGAALLLYALARTIVLRGLGGAADEPASLPAKLVQLASGLVHALTTVDLLAEPLAWVVGVAGWLGLALAARRQSRAAAAWAPLVWTLTSTLPLLAAPWLLGARYFYPATVGLAWWAADIARGKGALAVALVAMMAGLGLAQDVNRYGEVRAYDARVSAARRAVREGLTHGERVFHLDGGIKDIDLAVKEDPASADVPNLLVLGDVPASFVALPRKTSLDAAFLFASPPIPPSGAYQFDSHRVVGLARRGDDPTLDEVIRHLPRIRFIRLRPLGHGRVIYRDVTEALRDDVGATE